MMSQLKKTLPPPSDVLNDGLNFPPYIGLAKFRLYNTSDSVGNGISYLKTSDNGSYICMYNYYDGHRNNRGLSEVSQNNLKDSRCSGRLSYQSKTKIRRIINTWLNGINEIKKRNYKCYQDSEIYPTFCTLSLPSKQIYSDKEVKRECLNRFLIYIKRQRGVKNYLWVAEKQKNGNIHFHIIFDKYIDYKVIRDVWNKSLEKLGYIDEFEKKHGHRNPPTENIKKIDSIRNLSAYLSAYLTKELTSLKIEGKLWGCSKELTNLKNYTQIHDKHSADYMNRLIAMKKANFVEKEYSKMCILDKEYVDLFSNSVYIQRKKYFQYLSGLYIYDFNAYQMEVQKLNINSNNENVMDKLNVVENVPMFIQRQKNGEKYVNNRQLLNNHIKKLIDKLTGLENMYLLEDGLYELVILEDEVNKLKKRLKRLRGWLDYMKYPRF